MQQGYVHVYTGDGKGKTTAALGLALRAAGHGLRTYIGQFMKGQPYGEIRALAAHPHVTLEQFGDPGCIRREEVTQAHVNQARAGLARIRDAIDSGRYDIVVLDEVNVALWFGLLSVREVLELVEGRPAGVELVLTGRRAPPELVEHADLVTEMRCTKHYYERGVPARAGIEH